MVNNFHRRFDVIREQEFDIIKRDNFVFENNMLNEGMLNAKQTENNKKRLTFWSNFFNLLTFWLGDKLESLPNLPRVYKIYPESTKKRIYSKFNSKDKWTRKFIRVNKLTREFDNHDFGFNQ